MKDISPRIIAGEFRGRKPIYQKDAGIRPTADRVKESLFNILQARIAGSSFLDLFAGTGGIGLEALSRGSAHVVFADRDKGSVAAIESTLRLLGCEARARVCHGDYASVLCGLTEPFDIVYLDPPYESKAYTDAIRIICEGNLLAHDGVIIAEHNASFDTSGLDVFDHRKYGTVELTFMRGRR